MKQYPGEGFVKKKREVLQMKKKILCTLLAAAMVFSLAACGASDTGNGNASKETGEAVSQET